MNAKRTPKPVTSPQVLKYGTWYPCEIVRSTPTKHVVRFTQKGGKVVERTVPKADVLGYTEPTPVAVLADRIVERSQRAAAQLAQPNVVAVYGPNLATKGASFHVHAASCADTKKAMYRGHTPFELIDATEQEIVESIFVDIIAENEGSTWGQYADEVQVFPCAQLVEPKPAKRTAKAAATPAPVEQPSESHAWDVTLADLTAVQAQIDERNFSERRDAADPLMVRRNELILAAIEQGAGFAAIARARGVSSSTNRGLIRVLQGGKRI